MINDTKGIYLKIIVIGGGTGGYVAAPLASQLGAERPGGGGLHGQHVPERGMHPAKCLLHTAELVSQMNEQGATSA